MLTMFFNVLFFIQAFETVKPSTMSDLNVYEILGTKLEQSATYVVRVSTYTDYGVYSDSSNEIEFTTCKSAIHPMKDNCKLKLLCSCVIISLTFTLRSGVIQDMDIASYFFFSKV